MHMESSSLQSRVERWRMNDHVEILEQRVQPAAVGGRYSEKRLERVLVNDHQEQENIFTTAITATT